MYPAGQSLSVSRRDSRPGSINPPLEDFKNGKSRADLKMPDSRRSRRWKWNFVGEMTEPVGKITQSEFCRRKT
jgi:hypothetical protein